MEISKNHVLSGLKNEAEVFVNVWWVMLVVELKMRILYYMRSLIGSIPLPT